MKFEDLLVADPDRAYGIDVSAYQGKPKWEKVQGTGCSFVFCKATEGTSIQDSQFRNNYAGLVGSGMLRGAYHFFRGGNTGLKQAENFLHQITDLWNPISDLPPVIDVEALNDKAPVATQIQYILDWCEKVNSELCVYPMVYTSLRVVRDLFGNTDLLGGQYLWTVDYRTGISEPRIPPGFESWYFWQFSDKGSVAGINGDVDVNRFYSDAATLDTFARSVHYTSP